MACVHKHQVKELVSHMMLFVLLIVHIFVSHINSFTFGDVVGIDDTLSVKKIDTVCFYFGRMDVSHESTRLTFFHPLF
jgi:hypothetical protein